jgi:hypothetical protein
VRRGDRVWIWWGDGVAHQVKFVRWCRVLIPGTKRFGVGALVFSDFLFRGVLRTWRERGGTPMGFGKLNPSVPLYRADPRKDDTTAIQRPAFADVGSLRRVDFERYGLTR